MNFGLTTLASPLHHLLIFIRNFKSTDDCAGTHLEGYTKDQLISINKHWLGKNSEAALRDRTAFQLCHYGLLRGDNVRELELCDLHTLDLGPKEGYTEHCHAVVCTLRRGKTNQYGRIEFGSFMRNSVVEICPVGALAIYFFSR